VREAINILKGGRDYAATPVLLIFLCLFNPCSLQTIIVLLLLFLVLLNIIFMRDNVNLKFGILIFAIYPELFMYKPKIKGHVTINWGHVPICFKIGNVLPKFLLYVPDFNPYALNPAKKIMFMNNSE
jgi:hypothetical protein